MEIILEGLTFRGYGVAFRVLDSQYFGVAQRRRRVFIVGYLGAPCPPEVLFEPEGGGGPAPARRETGQDVASTLGGSTSVRGVFDLDRAGAFIPELAHPLASGGNDRHDESRDTYFAERARTLPVRGGGSSGIVVSPASDPDGMRETTGIPGRLDPATPDGPRYSAIGDAVTVPAIEWIGRRILAAHMEVKHD